MSIIYGIYHGREIIYIGSTKKSLQKRWNHHKSQKSKYPNRKLYKYMSQYDIQEFRIKKIAKVPTGKSTKEYEQKFIRHYSVTDNILNMNKSHT